MKFFCGIVGVTILAFRMYGKLLLISASIVSRERKDKRERRKKRRERADWEQLSKLIPFEPQAKVIGAPQAEDKLKYIGALVRGKFDFNASDKEELAKANKELRLEGVQLFFVDGDVCTNALIAVAHDHLLACDLVYGRSDGGFLGISKEEFDEFKDEHLSLRLFKYLICNKPNSPNGYLATYRCLKQNKKLFYDLHTPNLPDYGPHFDRPNILSFTNTQIHRLFPRFQMMDHTGIAQIMYEPPKSDGSTCTLMAASLRLDVKHNLDEQELYSEL